MITTMLNTYFLPLLVVLAAGYHVHATTTINNNVKTFTERLTNLLESKCLQSSAQTDHEKISKQFDHLRSCFALAIRPEELSNYKSSKSCQEQAENFLQCLAPSAEKIEPCLDPREKFLKQFIIDVHNASSEYFCNPIEVFNADQILKTKAATCVATLERSPEINNPHIVCFERSTVIGYNPTHEIITKQELCSNILQANYCYTYFLETYCPDAPEVHRMHRGLILAGINNCLDELFGGTTARSEHATNTTANRDNLLLGL